MNKRKLKAKLDRKINEFHNKKPFFPADFAGFNAGDGLKKTKQLKEIKKLMVELGDDYPTIP